MNYENNYRDIKETKYPNGKVWLVGAGPSDMELITVKGRRVLEEADVIVYDRLAGQGVLTYGRKDAVYICVGKNAGHHPVPQEEINRILVREAKKGQRVVRLKGGDPFVFGRGGEEALVLKQEGIPFEIVPGVTSAIAVPAYQGIPVTHRDAVSSVHIITAHRKDGGIKREQYEAYVHTGGTLVFLMGVSALPKLCAGLIGAGMPEDMPAAALERGTTARQRKITGTVGTLAKRAAEAEVQSPAIIVVGDVCRLTELEWYEARPLAGKKILVTRPKERASKLAEMLREEGAEVLELPSIRIEPIRENALLKAALDRIEQYRWMAFTSPGAVEVFFGELKKQRMDIRKLSGIKIAAVGAGTARELENYNLFADLMPEIYDGEHLGKALGEVCEDGDAVLIPRAAGAGMEIITALRENGVEMIADIPIYETCREEISYVDYKREFEDGVTDYAVFTSASTVHGFAKAAKGLDFGRVKALCIGKQTAAAAKSYGMQTDTAAEATLAALVELAVRTAEETR